MTIEQTVEVPASRRVFFDLPLSFPVGRANAALVLFPAAEAPAQDHAPEPPEPSAAERKAAFAKNLAEIRELCKGSTLTVDRFLELRHEETRREEAEYRRLFHHEDQA
jgi:hypothetical protein